MVRILKHGYFSKAKGSDKFPTVALIDVVEMAGGWKRTGQLADLPAARYEELDCIQYDGWHIWMASFDKSELEIITELAAVADSYAYDGHKNRFGPANPC